MATKSDLEGPGCTVAAVMAATDFVLPAVEVIDSRYRDFKFDLKSVIADNTSSSRFVAGGRARGVGELDLRTLGVVLEKNGEIVATATAAAVLGNPLAAVAMMANHLTARGQLIPAGTFIMTGGVTEAIRVETGDHIAAYFHDLGMVSMRFA
jgi:2-oxo-3-hexenedioate decarboxylase